MDQIIVVNKLTCAHNDIDKTHQSSYPETFAHVCRILTTHCFGRNSSFGNWWKVSPGIFSARLFWHYGTQQWSLFGMIAWLIVDVYTRGLALVTKVHDVNPRWLLCDKGEFMNQRKEQKGDLHIKMAGCVTTLSVNFGLLLWRVLYRYISSSRVGSLTLHFRCFQKKRNLAPYAPGKLWFSLIRSDDYEIDIILLHYRCSTEQT